MTKYKLAQCSNIPYTTLNDLCNGKTSLSKCSAETVYKIAKVLNISMEELLNRQEECV
ncbi:MAG: helix-turn-helix transcriptional regulator [Bacteroidaceae bacterium]|nr:helix-turn-helix transcriptional regulator [Bacteroidaceae bacterium]